MPLSSESGTYKTDSGLGFQAKVLKTFPGLPSSLGTLKPDTRYPKPNTQFRVDGFGYRVSGILYLASGIGYWVSGIYLARPRVHAAFVDLLDAEPVCAAFERIWHI